MVKNNLLKKLGASLCVVFALVLCGFFEMNFLVEKANAAEIEDNTNNTVKEQENGIQLGDNGVWYYFSNGKIDHDYRGLANNEYGWFYVCDGLIAWDYTGLANNEYGWFYVLNGCVDWNYTG